MVRTVLYIVGAVVALILAFFGGRLSKGSSAEAEKPKDKDKAAKETKAEAKEPAPEPTKAEAKTEIRAELEKLDDDQLKALLRLLAAQELQELAQKAKALTKGAAKAEQVGV